MPTYNHVHGPNEPCGPGCPGYYAAMEDGTWDHTNPWKDFDPEKKPAGLAGFNPENYYPNVPLSSNEKAFLWYATDNSGEHGDILDDTSHWRIIDRISKKNIYDFLKQSEQINLPMLWGYVVFLPNAKMYVKFLTHINPGKQDLEYMQPALKDLENHFHRDVVDYDQEDTKTPILESYTPTGETSGFSTTNSPEMGMEREPTNAELDAIENAEPNFDDIAGEFKTVRTDTLQSGVKISTVFLGNMAPNPDQPFETLVFETDDTSGKTLDVSYTTTQEQALTEHFKMVDKYNRLALEKSGAMNLHNMVVAYFNDAGITATEVHPNQLKLLPETHGINAVEIARPEGATHENGEKPFMYHIPSKTLFYTTQDCHHHHIVPAINQYLEDRGENYYGPWVTGDITSPEHTGDSWIKFLGSDTGQYPESVINYMQQKFGPRDLIYNGESGWEDLPERYIQKGE